MKIFLAVIFIIMFVKANENGIYKDIENSLMWQDNTDTKKVRKNWDAHDYCDRLSLAGHDDWHLPSKDDLKLLFRQRKSLKNNLSSAYWSSDNLSGKSDAAWIVFFSNGKELWRNKSMPNNVRCVRGFNRVF